MPEWAQELVQLHSSDGLVRADLQDLSCFSQVAPLQPAGSPNRNGGRHEVLRGTLPDGREFALKEYPAAQYGVLLREVRLLRKLRHPFVVEVWRVLEFNAPN
jgi:hypothetical protein